MRTRPATGATYSDQAGESKIGVGATDCWASPKNAANDEHGVSYYID